MGEPIVLGIDLGTTFSAMAHINRHSMPEVIPNAEGKRTMPSVVYFADDGTPIVGQIARNQALADPRRAAQFIKRHMGDPSYRLTIDGVDHVPEDLSALILKKLKEDAEAHLGESVTRAVISVPAYFKDAQRRATQLAGEIAGLDVFAILNEPTAAALAYGLTSADRARTLLIYDFGGGTFDVTILRIEGNEFTVLATGGDSQLGGMDVDQRLADHLADQYAMQRGVDLRADPASRQDLMERAEIAKIDLSGRQRVMVTLGAGAGAMRADVDRALLKTLIADLLERTRTCVSDALTAASLTWQDIDSVLPVGGSSRLVAVRELLRDMSEREVTTDVNPDECVALGAAIRTGLGEVTERAGPLGAEKGQAPPRSDIVVRDVAPHSLGVRALTPEGHPINSIIIPRLTEVPCERRRTYATRADNQQSIEIEVLQGEAEDPFSVEVESIGRVRMDELPARPAGQVVVEVLLRYDMDGVVEVEARELIEGRLIRKQLLERTGELDPEVVDAFKRRLATGEVDGTDGEAFAEDPGSPATAPSEPSDDLPHAPAGTPDDAGDYAMEPGVPIADAPGGVSEDGPEPGGPSPGAADGAGEEGADPDDWFGEAKDHLEGEPRPHEKPGGDIFDVGDTT
jgi:molecular chaperone DnaK